MIIRLAISWGGGIGGVPLGSHDKKIQGTRKGVPPNSVGPMVFIVFNLGILGDYI